MSAAYPRHRTLRAITDQLAEGKALSRICELPGMPSMATVMRWQLGNAELRDQFRRARQIGADVLAEECLLIADQATPENVRVARLRISTRLRLLPGWAPQTYGRPDQQTPEPVRVLINFAELLSSPPAAANVIEAASQEFPAWEEKAIRTVIAIDGGVASVPGERDAMSPGDDDNRPPSDS